MLRSTPRACNCLIRWVATRGAVLLLASVMACVGRAPADTVQAPDARSAALSEVRLRTTDGRRFVGELVRDVPSHVLLKIGGVEARFERSDVAKLVVVPSVATQFAQRRALLANDDLAGRLALAREMFAADLLDAARWELVLLQAALPEDGPGRDRVAGLLSAVEARRTLQDENTPVTAQTPGAVDVQEAATQEPKTPRTARPRPVYLSEADINLVRVYEIDLNAPETKQVSVPEVVLRAAMAENRAHPAVPKREADREALVAGSGRDQLAFLFGIEARSLYGQIHVRHDPETLAAFRRQINPVHVARYFEPQFGRGRIPGLELVRYRPNTTPEAYTNFVALCGFSYDNRLMIDRHNPEASLLLQWALPRDEALYPAPDLPNWRPRFRSVRDPRFVRLLGWIDGLVKSNIDYATLLSPEDPGEPAAPDNASEIGPGPAPATQAAPAADI